MAATFEDAETYLSGVVRTASLALNDLNEFDRNGDKYSTDARAALLDTIKAAFAPTAGLSDTGFVAAHAPE